MVGGECLNGIHTRERLNGVHTVDFLIWRFVHAPIIQNSAKNYAILTIIIAKIA